jgi:MSHA biogenesis protein MshP
MKHFQQGFGMITAIIVLVILASLAGAMVTFGSTQQFTSAQDVMGIRAWQAAKAGNEWGIYMALTSGTGWTSGAACAPAAVVGTPGTQQTKTIGLSADLGFSVTVTCSATKFNEGAQGYPLAPTVVTVYTIVATATNGTSVSSPGYVERGRVVIASN